jgi:hypothetical protein
MKCSDVYKIFFRPGEVTEIRSFGINGKSKAWEGWSRGTVFGYFDNAAAFGEAAEALDKAGARGIYFTVNPCNPDLGEGSKPTAVPDKKTGNSRTKIFYVCAGANDLCAKYAHEAGESASDAELKVT